jgi:hypothetical protein
MGHRRACPPPVMAARFSPGLRTVLLLLGRAGWLVSVVTALALFAIGLPARFHQLRTVSSETRLVVRGDPLGPLTALLHAALSPHAYPVIVLTQEILLVAGLTVVGLIVSWRKSRQWQALLFSLAMITYGPYITGSLNALLSVHPGLHTLIRIFQATGIGCAVLSGYLFPDGRFIPRWARYLALVWLGWLLAGMVYPGQELTFTNPFALDKASLLALIAWLLTTLVAQEERYRRASDQLQRRQTRWVLLCMTNTIVTYSVLMLPHALVASLNVPGRPSQVYLLIGYPLFLLSLPVSPLIILIAIMRRHLFDIDAVVNRALVYGTLTLTLGLIYAGSILLLGYPLNRLTGGTQLAVIGSTLATATLFRPLRGRIQAGIDRRFYRRKYNMAKTLDALQTTLHGDVDLQQVCERVIGLVEETMQPAHLSLWLSPPGWHELPPSTDMTDPQG